MSVVTSIIILFPRSENEEARIGEVNEFVFESRNFHFQWIDSSENLNSPIKLYGGNRVFNSVLLLASYTNFPTDYFLKYLHEEVGWEDIEDVQVLINSEVTNDKTCRIYSHAGKKLLIDSTKW